MCIRDRNDTIAAKLITAVLHLDEGSRVLLCLVYKELLKVMLSIIYIVHGIVYTCLLYTSRCV